MLGDDGMYSCGCGYRKDDFWHCGACQSDAECEDPNVDEELCNNEACEYPHTSEIYLEDATHYSCSREVDGKYCVHYCDDDDSCAFLVGPIIPPEDNWEWHYADNYPDDVWYDCPSCDYMTWKVIVAEDEDGDENTNFEAATCANLSCSSSVDVSNLKTPLSIRLACNSEDCDGVPWSEFSDEDWPSEYYCDCCSRTEPSEWDSDEDDFYCDRCEKYHDDDNDECAYSDNYDCDYDDDDDEDDDEGVEVQIEIDLAKGKQSNYQYFLGADRNTYITVQCDRCSNPLHCKVGLENIDDFWTNGFYNAGEQIARKNLFPSLEQVYELPSKLEKNDFVKSDFNKTDFNKSDFMKE